MFSLKDVKKEKEDWTDGWMDGWVDLFSGGKGFVLAPTQYRCF